MKFYAKHFDELTTRELYEIARSRAEIFLLEQGIVCQDFDGKDYESLHCFYWEEDRVVAYLRAYLTEENTVKIGRVLSLRHKKGMGSALWRKALATIRQRWQDKEITVHAQVQAQGFYEKQGFVPTSPVFDEEGIPHIAMRLKD
ncbi:MAG: GNAT family N-acetyltransferase [Clostridia bacterium]|nr:GNAT family N-acetyltransferase [Clostridia bacterium]